jgi:hypothetical protein
VEHQRHCGDAHPWHGRAGLPVDDGCRDRVTGVFTVAPVVTANASNVRYIVSGMNEWQSVSLQPDGTARISWTPSASGSYWLQFLVQYSDGTYSFTRYFSVTVL